MTNAVIETLMTRRSVRAFQEKSIPSDQLQAILETARFAPSGMGRQTWKFTAVTNRDKIQKLAAAISKELGREGYNMYQPEVLIIPSNDVESKFGKEDNACALENIFLAAWSFGIGSVWINQLQGICDRPAIREILDSFGIPKNHVVYGMAALGYPAQEPKKDVEKIGEVAIVESLPSLRKYLRLEKAGGIELRTLFHLHLFFIKLLT